MPLPTSLSCTLLLLAAAQGLTSQTVTAGACHAGETPSQVPLRAPSCEHVRLEAKSPAEQKLREGMQHLDAARRIPCTPYPPPPPQRTFGICGNCSSSPWPPLPYDGSDEKAVVHFAAAARCCPVAAEAVLAFALVADDPRVARRAVAGVHRGWRPENCGDHRLTTQLLFFSGAGETNDATGVRIAAQAINMLWSQLEGPRWPDVRRR